jgi:glycine cleavage system transcriptional repressor
MEDTMTKRFIMTAFAKDRLGLVADITKIVFQNGCNLENTQMTQLEDEFVIMLLFTGEKEELEEQISKDCRRLEREKNISAYVRELDAEISKPLESFTTHSIHAEGIDQAGIVYKISNFLAARSINISCLTSHKTPTPESGTPIYTVEIEIQVAKGTSLEELEQKLSELGHEIHIEFNIDKIQ